MRMHRNNFVIIVILFIVFLLSAHSSSGATTLRIKGGTYIGISSPDFIKYINGEAEKINTEDRLSAYGLGLNLGFDILFEVRNNLLFGPTFFIESSRTSAYFDLPGDNAQEYFYTSASLGCVGGRVMLRLPFVFDKYPYIFASSGLAIGYVNMEDIPNRSDIPRHFPYGQYYWYRTYVSVGAGYQIPFFNIGDLFAQIEFVQPFGSFNMKGNDFIFRGLDISGGYSRDF